MLMEWYDKYNIGVPEVDAEHRYLVALINNLHDDFSNGKIASRLSDAFVHLTKYTIKHFRNEERLMKAVEYPDLMAHIDLHEDLVDQLSDLTKKYMSGEEHLSEDTMLFLKGWLYDHILQEDQEIGRFLDGKSLPSDLAYTSAYSDGKDGHFMTCSCCGASWPTFDDLAADHEIVVLGVMPDAVNQLFNLVTFNCSCGTTMAVPLATFINNSSIPFGFVEPDTSSGKPDYCLWKANDKPCLSKCVCQYADKVMTALKGSG